MAGMKHNVGNVNLVVEDVRTEITKYDTAIADIETLTSNIISCHGFRRFVGGLSAGQYSGQLEECKASCQYIADSVRNIQLTLIKYHQSQEALNEFLLSVTADEWAKLGYTGSNIPKDLDDLSAMSTAELINSKNYLNYNQQSVLDAKLEKYGWGAMALATLGLTGAKLVEGAVGTVGTWIDGVATGIAVVGRGLRLDTTGLEKWIATEHVDNVANSLYKTGVFDAAIYEYNGTAAKVVETVGNAIPYMVISGATSYKGITKVASNTWGAYAKAGLAAAKKEMIIDTALGTLGGFGEGTAQGLQEGMDLGDAITTKGLQSAGRELVLGATGNVAGELIGSTAKFAKNTGILNLVEEGTQQATKQAIEGMDGHKLIGAYDDGSLVGNRLVDAYQESAENASGKLRDLNIYKQGEYDRIVAEETEKVGKNALDTFEKANAGNVDDAYRKVAQQNTEAQIEQQVRETVEKEIRDDIAKKGYSSQTMIDTEFNSPARKAEFDMKLAERTQDISTQASEILAKEADGGVSMGKEIIQKAEQEAQKASIEQSARTAAEERVNDLVKNNPSLKESTLKDLQQEAEKQIKNSIEQQKSTLATGLGKLSSQKGRNIVGIRNKASEFDKFSSNFGKDALDNATTSARKALNDALDTAQATGTKLTGQELRDIASKAAKESIEISTLTKGSQAAKNALSATNEEFATRLSRLEKGETIDDIIKSSDPKKGTDSSKPNPTKPDSSKPDSSKPDSSKPDSSKPDSSKPDSSKPDSSKPDSSKPDSTKPDSSKPDSTKPDSSKPPKKEEVNWEKPVEKTNPETGTKYTETKGKDLQGRDVVESKAKDGSSTVTTVGKQGDDTVEIVESYNKAGVKSQQTTTIKAVDPTTGKVQVKERIVEGLDGTVTERRTWESTNKYTATITDNTGKDKFIKTVTVGRDGETPVNIILKDIDNNLLKTTDITTKTPNSAQFKLTGDEIEIPGLSKGPIKLDANQYLDMNGTTVTETLTTTTKNGVDKVTKKFEFDVNVNGSTETIKYTVVEQADGTYRISKQFDNGTTRIEISHPKGKAPTIIEETIDSTGKRITTTSRTGKPTIIKTVNPDGSKIIQKGTGSNPTIIKETFDPDNMTKTRETIHNGTTETVIEKYDPQTRTKSYVDEKGNTIRKDKTYDKPTYDKPNSETQPKVDDGKLDNGPGKGENDNRPDTSKDPTKPEIKTEPSKKIDSARNHPILRQIKPNYLGQYDVARYYKNAEFKKINKELYNGELTKLRTSKTKYIEIGKEAVYNKHLSEALEKAGVKNADELGEDILKQVRKNADDEIAKLSKNKLKKLGKQDIKARCEDNAWKKVDEMLATDAGQKKLTNIGRGHQAGRAAAAALTALLWPKGEGGTGEDYIPTTTPIETVPTVDPYIPPSGGGGGGGGSSSGGGGGGATPTPSDEITNPNDIIPNETPVSTTATPEQPETLPPEEEVITGITDNQPTTGGGNNWGQTGGGQSFNDTVPPEDDLTDEDTLLGDENLDDLEIEDVYTIPMASDGSYSSVTKDGVNPVPILAGLGLVAAAGVGAKIYMDNKKNNENGDDDEFMDDSEFEEFSSTDSDLIADEWTDETLGEDMAETDADYERPSFYSDTLGDEI